MTSRGPDLGAAGIDAAEVSEGAVVCGSFRGDPVVLVKNRGAYFALSGTCTHLDGPLGEGILVDGTLRCPWHHARFSVATGEAVSAPAFCPLTRFGTELRDGRVFVTDSPETASAAAASASAKRVVIVGAGAGGHACAELLARSGFKGSVTVVGEDADPPYDRTFCSKQYLIGMKSREETALCGPEFYGGPAQSQRPVLRTGCKVSSIDVQRRTLRLATDEALPFDYLVLATGAEPKRPRIPGFDLPNVHVLRTLRDADALIEASKEASRVAIVGSSFIGLEAAASLKQRKLDVHVVTPDRLPLEKLLGAQVATMILEVHKEKGVHFHLGREVRSFSGTELTLDDGSTIEADFVVLGVGVSPRTELAEAAGLRCASAQSGGGVLVNERLETSSPGIFAIGDITRYPDRHSAKSIRVEHWVHAERQGQHVARVLLGSRAPYGDLPFFWSAHFDTGLRYLGHVDTLRGQYVDGSVEGRQFTLRLTGDGQDKAFVTCNRDMPALTVEAEWESAVDQLRGRSADDS